MKRQTPREYGVYTLEQVCTRERKPLGSAIAPLSRAA
jgi:hypothetical protein